MNDTIISVLSGAVVVKRADGSIVCIAKRDLAPETQPAEDRRTRKRKT